MGVFTRITDIVQANVIAALDKAENPEKLVKLMIQEMEETLVEIRSTSAKFLAEKKELQRTQANYQQSAQYWQEKAELAVSKERDDLAKAALIEKHNATLQADALSDELGRIEHTLDKLTQDSQALQQKLTQAKAKQESYSQREQVLTSRLKVNSQLHSNKIADAMARFELIERKVDDIEAQVESYELTQAKTLKAQFSELESSDKIDEQLAKLKEKVAHKAAV